MAVTSLIAIGENWKYAGATASTDTKSLSSLTEILNGPEGPPVNKRTNFEGTFPWYNL
jgi:hypothetical protein